MPFKRNFSLGKTPGSLAHQYATFFSYKHYRCGFGEEGPAQLREAGQELMSDLLRDEDRRKFDFDTLLLFKRYYHLSGDTIKYTDDLMYEQAVKP